MHVTTYCNLISRKPTVRDWLTLQLIFSPDYNLKLRRKNVSKLGKRIQTTTIEVTTSSLVAADKELFFFTQTDIHSVSEEKFLQGKKQSRQNAIKWVADTEPSKSTTSVKKFTKNDGNTTSYSMNGIKACAWKSEEQDVHLIFGNLGLKLLGQPYDEVLLTTDKRYKH